MRISGYMLMYAGIWDPTSHPINRDVTDVVPRRPRAHSIALPNDILDRKQRLGSPDGPSLDLVLPLIGLLLDM